MPTVVADCPRCGARHMTFDVHTDVYIGARHGWLTEHEIAVVCRRCKRISILKIEITAIEDKHEFRQDGEVTKSKGDLEPRFRKIGFLDVSDLEGVTDPPDYLPPEIASAFSEGAKCMSIKCYNASAAMFRLCLDLATKPLLPNVTETAVPQPSKYERFNLGARIDWLIKQGKIPAALAGLAHSVRQDGNDGAHDGSLDDKDAADLLDFTIAVLERQFTEPERLRLAEVRRIQRRGGTA